ncbi:unnamed protein product [Rotaria socialis]|uniref:Uncharacterized protein n=1 Tax=Rotaria socialis TaxID=392032 RepID=A0A817P6R9_9BILA|nr:unnamed protein product [Rotaria socialis]CAF4180524.1 unnamed protein product [Rotaria socialis]CAF4196449.1 unnamed protein product [Rotaria socialis]CAF4713274.1 unnamed protein product [Rotaria socialis]
MHLLRIKVKSHSQQRPSTIHQGDALLPTGRRSRSSVSPLVQQPTLRSTIWRILPFVNRLSKADPSIDLFDSKSLSIIVLEMFLLEQKHKQQSRDIQLP